MPKPHFILEFAEVDREHTQDVGAKAANLGELAQAGFPIPDGFIISSLAYDEFTEQNNLKKSLRDVSKTVNEKNIKETQSGAKAREKLILKADFPQDLKKEIVEAYGKLGRLFRDAHVAVRPSSTSSDCAKSNAQHSQETLLNVKGEASLLESIKNCWAKGRTAIIVQKMVDADVSGIAYTVDPTGGKKHQMLIEAVWGLGELATSGQISPDKYLLERHTLKIEDILVTEQDTELGLSGTLVKSKKVSSHRIAKQKLPNVKILELAKILQKVHAHYFFPQDVEWAKHKGRFYLLHVRPVATPVSGIGYKVSENREKNTTIGKIILQGQVASPGIVTGHVRIVRNLNEMKNLKKGEILITNHISPSFIPAMRFVGAIIAELGGVTSHAAIIARELGIPCIVGADKATSKLKNGEVVTVNAKEGTVGRGRLMEDVVSEACDYVVERVRIRSKQDLKTATKIYLNLAEPEKAKEAASLPSDGVGLLRAEFMISELGVHPRHVISQDRQKWYVEKLVQGIEKFCLAFDDRPVIYRTADFKTNEYRNLHGGKAFETEEDNPMLGFRGAFRYIADPEVFELELAAVRQVREKYKNLFVMIPYVRSPDELLHVKRIMAASGLYRSPSFKLWMMIELPINVILIEDFIKVGIDGVSFGSNDLTMLLLGTDRDNNEVREAYNELSPAVFWALERVIKACKKHGVVTSICGQAASTYDTLVERLVELGIGSVSVRPDSLGRVQKVIYETERRI